MNDVNKDAGLESRSRGTVEETPRTPLVLKKQADVEKFKGCKYKLRTNRTLVGFQCYKAGRKTDTDYREAAQKWPTEEI